MCNKTKTFFQFIDFLFTQLIIILWNQKNKNKNEMSLICLLIFHLFLFSTEWLDFLVLNKKTNFLKKKTEKFNLPSTCFFNDKTSLLLSFPSIFWSEQASLETIRFFFSKKFSTHTLLCLCKWLPIFRLLLSTFSRANNHLFQLKQLTLLKCQIEKTHFCP